MKTTNFKYLLDKDILSVNRVVIIEDGIEYEKDDTIILKLSNNEFIQILADYDVIIYRLDNISHIKIIGEFEPDTIKLMELMNVSKFNVHLIKNYILNPYNKLYIGSEFLNSQGVFIFGFTYTEDEVNLIFSRERLSKVLQQSLSENGFSTLVIKGSNI
jgi:hypothetical protein